MDKELKNRVELTKHQWLFSGFQRYGDDKEKWKFRCPACREVFTLSNWRDSVSKNRIDTKQNPLPLQDCPAARVLNDDLCIWFGFGSLNPIHIQDDMCEFLTTAVFDFADDPLIGG